MPDFRPAGPLPRGAPPHKARSALLRLGCPAAPAAAVGQGVRAPVSAARTPAARLGWGQHCAPPPHNFLGAPGARRGRGPCGPRCPRGARRPVCPAAGGSSPGPGPPGRCPLRAARGGVPASAAGGRESPALSGYRPRPRRRRLFRGAGRAPGRLSEGAAAPRPRRPRSRRSPAPCSPATGDGLRSTSHLLFHCGDRGGVSSRPRPAPAPRPPRAPTFLPSRSLTWPSTSAASVIFGHGSRAPAAPLPAAPRPPQPRVTFKIAPGGPWAGPARAGRGGGRGVRGVRALPAAGPPPPWPRLWGQPGARGHLRPPLERGTVPAPGGLGEGAPLFQKQRKPPNTEGTLLRPCFPV